jgi:hypothetical protein
MSDKKIVTKTLDVEDLVDGIINMFEVNQITKAEGIASLMAALVTINKGENAMIECNDETYYFGKE